jgi:hypothetical protein
MAFGDPPPNIPRWPQPSAWSDQLPLPLGDSDNTEEQWLFQFHEHLLLTVQAIHRLHGALAKRML